MYSLFGTRLVCGLLLLATAACRKHDLLTTSNYSFTNSTSERLQLDIYASEEDYANNRHPVAQQAINPGDEVTVPLEAMTTVWVDWYNADYTLHNWTPRAGASAHKPYPVPRMEVAAADDRQTISCPVRDTSRSVILNGGTSSTWEVTIDDQPDMDGTYRLLLKKDFTGRLSHTDLSGNTMLYPVTYISFNEGLNTKSFSLNVTRSGADTRTITLYFSDEFYPYSARSRDTLVGFFGDKFYRVVRQ